MPEKYKIGLVETWTFLNLQRNPVKGYRITFTIPDLNITDQIEISTSAYNAENVKKAIEEKILLHRELLSP